MMLDTLELEFCDGELNLSPLQEQQWTLSFYLVSLQGLTRFTSRLWKYLHHLLVILHGCQCPLSLLL